MTHYYYGRFLYKLGEFSAAAIHLSKAIKFLPTDAWVHYDVGRAFHQTNNLEKAMNYYKSSWDISPTSIAANAIGAIHMQQGQFQKARSYFDASIARDSENIEAQINIAILTIQTGSVSDGERAIQKLLKSYPNSLSAQNAARAYNISSTSP
tara:strand:- start:119 stop:574 length:456 start_codon:yes stop_codon:yes gene_type:complete